jgi:predicted DNA-binding protein (UPF0251 family)
LDVRGFRPIGRPACRTPVATIGRDALEAIRLADIEGLYQEAAAERMGVSRQTFARILARAHAIVARCLIEGQTLVVEPGSAVDSPAPPDGCPIHGGGRRRGRGCHCPRAPECAADGPRDGLPVIDARERK